MKANLWYAIPLLVFFVSAVQSQVISDRAATPQVQAQLVASAAAVQPGREIYVGVHQQIIPHWHTYWINPGDSGSATTIEWTLPSGAKASDILWPAPDRFSMGPITNYAYENSVTLLSKIAIPADAQPGEQFSIRALVDWLVCKEECIPQQVQLALSLPIVEEGIQPGPGSGLIDTALARLPIPIPWTVTAHQSPITINSNGGQGELQLHITLPQEQLAQVEDIWFYPYDWGRIRQSDPQVRVNLVDGIQLQIPTGETPVAIGDQLAGVLVITEQQGIARGYELRVPVQQLNSNPSAAEFSISFAGALLFALVGGIILNLMPCVFPVLSIKALSLVSHSHYSAQTIRRQGYVYTLGVLTSFAVLALLLIVLKASGSQIGWGFQFQSPIFVLVVAYLLFAVGLSLSGVFFIGGSVAGVGASLAEKPGYSGSFFTGVLATVVATPCTAPFMAAAVGYALVQPPAKLLAIFLSLGLGLALPYLLLSCWPRLQRWLPRPGLWMERAKQLLAFPMYAAAIWLVWVLVQQAGVNAVIVALGGMLIIALAAWLYDSTRASSHRGRWLGTSASLVLVVSAVGAGLVATTGPLPSSQSTTAAGANWEEFSSARLQELRAQGKPVFLNFTASWCISCLVNERVALSAASVKKQFTQRGIVYLKGDWTNKDPHITAFLQEFNRSGVPLYVFYPEGQSASPVELPQILTPDIVIATLGGP